MRRTTRRPTGPTGSASGPAAHGGFLAGPGPLAFAHRGGARVPELVGLENTLTAFRHAVSLGYRYLETDVHLSADGVLLAFHDDVLDRVTDRVGAVADLTYQEISEARIGGRERVPRLADLVESLPDALFNIDLKSERAVEALATFVDERDLHDRVLVGSFSGRRLAAFRRRTGGRVATSAHPIEVAAYLILPGRLARLVLRALTHGRPSALQVPHRSGPVRVAGPRLVRHAHAVGLPVHVWTIDDATEIRLLLDRGVDGLFTDRTDILRSVLRARGSWPSPSR